MKQNTSSLQLFLVTRAEAGQTLQAFLSRKYAVSLREAKALLDARRVWVNRRLVWMARHPLKAGDVMEAPKPDAKRGEKTLKPEAPRKIRVLVENDNYLVVDKPAKLLSVGKNSVEALLREQTGNPSVCAVHRLDRDTTGCLLFAKSEAAREAAVMVYKTHKVSKFYQAVVAGYYDRKSSTLTAELDGERAISHITRIMATKDASFLKIRIETGRTHQIRRHLSMLHFPVLGDSEYGMKKARDPRMLTLPRHMLHACSLELQDPLNPHEEIKAHSPLPADFRRCLQLFGMGR